MPFWLVTLPGLVEAHEAGREHLGVDAVATAVALGEERRDDRRHRADAGLQRGAVGHERAHVLGDRPVDVGGRRVGGLHGRLVALDEDVDLVERERVDVRRPLP